jgi:hypothetical protein
VFAEENESRGWRWGVAKSKLDPTRQKQIYNDKYTPVEVKGKTATEPAASARYAKNEEFDESKLESVLAFDTLSVS